MAKERGVKGKEILFKKGIKIQGLNRVALPKELLENLDLREGDKIVLYFDPNSGSIIIRREK
ncbi:hypothetical protein COU60_01305 [Candidatus Pacearchaeota archaeon CG10_big_fil_rev_8_21_14_0_10_34_76]|nr:MAG: hypothetical protein COU60_01305 [Candidatus Pacearchaeota archaeon CG10_big_fil_rev_8_21_14_0_10_34_76]